MFLLADRLGHHHEKAVGVRFPVLSSLFFFFPAFASPYIELVHASGFNPECEHDPIVFVFFF
jgi:hypothetical protein